jgi:hypothetical protein
MDFLPVNMLLLRLYIASGDLFYTTATVLGKIFNAVESAFKDRTYIFLEGYSTPFQENAVNVHASSSAIVDFYYNADKKQFVTGTGSKKTLPILSLDILRDGIVTFDLTDFIEGITVYSDNGFPSVSQIVNAWMIDSHVILTRECDFVVRVISCDGLSHDFSIYNDLDIGEAILEKVDVPVETAIEPVDAVTDAVTDTVTDTVTDAVTDAATDAVTDAVTDAATEPLKIE